MWVATNLKCLKCIWNLKFVLHFNGFMWGVRTHTKPHTQLKQKKQEERCNLDQNWWRKRRKRRSRWTKQKEECWGKWLTTWENNKWWQRCELSATKFFHFLQVFSTPDFHFSAEMSEIRLYVWYSPVRPGIFSSIIPTISNP